MLQLINPFNLHTLVLVCLLLPMSLAFLGCDANDGPAEKAGERIDKASEDIKSAGEDITND
jgi:hypothetical protein